MKIYYNSRLTFQLPTDCGYEKRLAVVEEILENHQEYFVLDEHLQSSWNRNIFRVLSQLATYLLTAERTTKDGKALRHDKEILRSGKLASIRRRELPLLSQRYS